MNKELIKRILSHLEQYTDEGPEDEGWKSEELINDIRDLRLVLIKDKELSTEHQARINEFMEKAKQELPHKPTIPSREVGYLRAALILEEAFELINEGLGIDICVEEKDGEYRVLEFNDLRLRSFNIADMIKIADGCADLSVVNIGTLSACGIKDKPLLEAVDKNNLEKFGPGHSIIEDGKLIKPENHKPPDIEKVLRDQGWEG